jgi:hypothetical protein
LARPRREVETPNLTDPIAVVDSFDELVTE